MGAVQDIKEFIYEWRFAVNMILIFGISYYTGALIGLANSRKAKDSPKDQDLP